MKGGYNNGTNSSAAASLLGLSTALSRATLSGNASDYKNNHASRNGSSYAGGHSTGIDTEQIISKFENRPKTERQVNVGNNTAKFYSAAMPKKRESRLNGATNASVEVGNKTESNTSVEAGNKTLDTKEKYRYDDYPKCVRKIRKHKIRNKCVVGTDIFAPNPISMLTSRIKFIDENGKLKKEMYTKEGHALILTSLRFNAHKNFAAQT